MKRIFSAKKSFLVRNRRNINDAIKLLSKARQLAQKTGMYEEAAQEIVNRYPKKSVRRLVKEEKEEYKKSRAALREYAAHMRAVGEKKYRDWKKEQKAKGRSK